MKALLVPAGEGLSSIEATAAVNAAIGVWEQQQSEHQAAAEALLSPQQKARLAATKGSARSPNGGPPAAPAPVAKPAAPAAAATSPKGGSGDSARVPFAGVQYFQAAAKVRVVIYEEHSVINMLSSILIDFILSLILLIPFTHRLPRTPSLSSSLSWPLSSITALSTLGGGAEPANQRCGRSGELRPGPLFGGRRDGRTVAARGEHGKREGEMRRVQVCRRVGKMRNQLWREATFLFEYSVTLIVFL